jgi:hypothetical protein
VIPNQSRCRYGIAVILAGAILGTMSLSCHRQKEIPRIPELKMSGVQRCDYLSTGRYEAKQEWHSLSGGDSERLAGWLKTKSDWTRCSEDIAPHVVFRAKSFNLNIVGAQAVLNYEVEKGTWRQVCTSLKPRDNEVFEQLARSSQ